MSFQTTIYGKYFLLDRIAVGGMAEVFKAKTFGVRGFERLLVIKRILPHLSKDEEFVEMFIDEAKIAVELTHANICQVTDLGKIGNNYFIAMEYIDGKDLRAVLKKSSVERTSLSVAQAIFLASEICKGLDYAHKKLDSVTGKPLNVIHRDISPQNVMLSYHGEVKIVDFGIAKTESKLSRTQAGVLKGKFGYMSPEQASGLELDSRTDIFSAGIILFEMLTGRRLFLGDSDFATLEKIKDCDVPPPSKYNPAVTEELEEIVLKALAKEKEDRFSTAGEMQTALSRILYTKYSEFHVEELSSFMKDLFKTEIEEEKESLRRALDALPADQLAAITNAAESENDRIASSLGSQAKPPPDHSQTYRARSGIGLQLDRLKERLRIDQLPPAAIKWGKVFLFGILPAVLLVFLWNALSKDSVDQPTNATPTPAAIASTVKFTSSPPEARIFIDDKPQGSTPALIDLPPQQTYQMRLEKDGYKTLEERVLITSDQNIYSFTLQKDLPPMGSLRITSNPEGATIFYDHRRTDLKTPATIDELKIGAEHTIRLELSGYRPEVKQFVMENPTEELLVTLEKNIATLKINVEPKDASVFLDGKERGHIIEELPADKTYTLTVKASGYVTETRKIKPIGPTEEVDITLKKQSKTFGTISLNALPWASVIVDGKVVGHTPILNYKLPIGSHQVIFRNKNYKDVVKTIRIKAGTNNDLIVDLRKEGQSD